jgi:hypothetical protein
MFMTPQTLSLSLSLSLSHARTHTEAEGEVEERREMEWLRAVRNKEPSLREPLDFYKLRLEHARGAHTHSLTHTHTCNMPRTLTRSHTHVTCGAPPPV